MENQLENQRKTRKPNKVSFRLTSNHILAISLLVFMLLSTLFIYQTINRVPEERESPSFDLTLEPDITNRGSEDTENTDLSLAQERITSLEEEQILPQESEEEKELQIPSVKVEQDHETSPRVEDQPIVETFNDIELKIHYLKQAHYIEVIAPNHNLKSIAYQFDNLGEFQSTGYISDPTNEILIPQPKTTIPLPRTLKPLPIHTLNLFLVSDISREVISFQLDIKTELQKSKEEQESLAKNSSYLEDIKVNLDIMISNSATHANLFIGKTNLKKILYKFENDQDFKETGYLQTIDPITQQEMPNPSFILPSNLSIEKTYSIQIKWIDQKDIESSPKTLIFEPKKAIVKNALYLMNMSFPNKNYFTGKKLWNGEYIIYYTGLLSFKNAFTKVQYSIDNNSLDQVLKFNAPKNRLQASTLANEESFLKTDYPANYIYTKLYFIDGSSLGPIRVNLDFNQE